MEDKYKPLFIHPDLNNSDGDDLDGPASTREVQAISETVRQIVESVHEGIIVCDRSLRCRVWNPFMEHITGVPAAQVLGRKAEEVFPFLRDTGVIAKLQAVLEGEEVTKVSLAYERETTGDSVWTSYNSYPLRDSSGEITGVIGIVTDITEQKRAEEALQKSHDLLKKMSAQVPGLLYQFSMSVDGKFSFPYTSSEMEKVLGITPEKAKTDAAFVFDHVHPDDLALMMEGVTESLRDMSVWKQEFRVLVPGNGTMTYLGNSKPERMPDGSITWHGFMMDISERKRIEVEMKENQEHLRMALSAANMGEWTYNVTEGKRYFDEDSCRHLGINSEAFAGDPEDFFRVVHPDDLPMVKKRLGQALDKDVPYEVEYRVIHPDETVHHVAASARTTRDKDGNPEKLSGLVWDITGRKMREEEEMKIDRLESLGVLAGGIAHDFNNLLGAIMGNASMALEDDVDAAMQKEMLAEIVEASRRATTLTKQLLAFAKGGVTAIELQDASKVIKESAGFIVGKSSASHCDFRIAGDLWPAKIDAGQIAQVIENLVINANQAMPEGGAIVVEAKNVKLDDNNSYGLKPGAYIHASVTDTGIGIPDKYISKIFDPYFTTKSKGRGTGLGLAVAHAAIQKHSGYLGVESKQGEGTTFHILLPAEEQTPVVKSKRHESIERQKNMKVLVMDDEFAIRRLLKNAMTRLGHSAVVTAHGGETLERYKEAMNAGEPFDLVMLDLTVPGGMGGVETLKRLRLIDPAVIAIVSSGFSDTLPEGFNASIPKPYTMEEIAEVFKSLMEKTK